MAATTTGEMFTDDEIQKMSVAEFNKKGIVAISSEEEKILGGMNRADRRAWLKKNKKFKRI